MSDHIFVARPPPPQKEREGKVAVVRSNFWVSCHPDCIICFRSRSFFLKPSFLPPFVSSSITKLLSTVFETGRSDSFDTHSMLNRSRFSQRYVITKRRQRLSWGGGREQTTTKKTLWDWIVVFACSRRYRYYLYVRGRRVQCSRL